MWWRLRPSDNRRNSGADNRAAFKDLVDAGEPTGLLAYFDDQPVGWCSLAPREQFVRLRSSRTWRLVPGEEPVWSLGCFFVADGQRGKAISTRLLAAAVRYARKAGAPVLEAYPYDNANDRLRHEQAWHGTLDAFLQAGFSETARFHPNFPILRRKLR